MATKEKSKEASDGESAEASPPKKSSMKWIIAGVTVLLLVGGGGAFAWFKFLAPHKVEGKSDEKKATEVKATEGKSDAGITAKMGPIFDLDPFIVNLADVEPRFLKVTIKLELDGPLAKDEVAERMPQVRDAILLLLSSKETQVLKPTAGKLQLRDEILERINALLANGQAKSAYFTEFVVQ